LLDGNKVLINNIEDNIPEKLILGSIKSNKYLKEQQEHSFLIKKLELGD
jgi:hypothetical protein